MYLRPLLRQKPCPGRFTFREGGWKSVRDRSPRTPLRTPPPGTTDRGGWGEVKINKCPQTVCKLFVRCLCTTCHKETSCFLWPFQSKMDSPENHHHSKPHEHRYHPKPQVIAQTAPIAIFPWDPTKRKHAGLRKGGHFSTRILVFENDRFLVLENDRHPSGVGKWPASLRAKGLGS